MKHKVVFLPGLLNDASLFKEQIAALSTLGSVDVVDLTRSDSIADLAGDALKNAPEKPFLLVGLSMGGYVAFEMMRQAPARVYGLVLMDTSARPDTADNTSNRLELMKLAESNFGELTERLLPRLSHPERMSHPSVRGVIQSMAASLGKDVFMRQQKAIMGRPDSMPTLGTIRCPTLVICGREDLITPPESSEEITAGIANAELKIIEQCGHLSTLDQPKEVNKVLLEWIDRIWSR